MNDKMKKRAISAYKLLCEKAKKAGYNTVEEYLAAKYSEKNKKK
jgi:hypothetical protein